MNANGYGIKVTRSDGLIFNYENDEWALISVKGIDFAAMEVFREPKGLGHGDIITGKRRQSREIEVTLALREYKEDVYRLNREQAIGFHNNNYTFQVEIGYHGERKIAKDCVIKAASYPSERYRKNPIMTILFLSPEADLFAANTDSVSFISTTPIWHVTRAYEGQTGKLAFGALEKAEEKVINYLGSEHTPIVITIKATGYVNGVVVGIGTKSVSITTKLYASDVMVIDTGERVVSKNGAPVPMTEYDAMALMGLILTYGDNIVKVNSSSTAFTAEVDFVGRYGGL
jgi:hypothetical protein